MRIVVTGAFGYSGRYIANRLLEKGHRVMTLTHSVDRPNPYGDRIEVHPFHFDQPEELTRSLQGAEVLINTYWVRFDHRLFSQAGAVANTLVMFQAAKNAGVKRIVHLSISNPDLHSDLRYFRGKAELELALKSLGCSYCILRPTVLFGKEDILINNIAWSLRHLPVFGVFGQGDYRLQPIYVDDLAAAAVAAAQATDNQVREAIGPETYRYREMVRMIADALGLQRPIVGVPPWAGYQACRLMGWLMHDVIITRDEIRGLMEERLYVDAPALGATKLSEWVRQQRDMLGRHYASEMARRIP